MNLKEGFSRYFSADPSRLHFAAHSHHPWPDVSHAAHAAAWEDAANLVDDKWDHIFGTVLPGLRSQLAQTLDLADPQTLVFAPNTHEFLTRLHSCFEPPVNILASDAEFHSFTRQSRRWEEAGLAAVDRVPAEPFDTFAERFTERARSGSHNLIYLSSVFFDSGFVVPELDRIVSSVSDERALFVIDGYHAFMALPVDLGPIQDRAFFMAGGYKYAMAGEGICFMHCPPGYGARPTNTGWYAGFGQLEAGVSKEIAYGIDASRFAGATFDPSGAYRMAAVLDWLKTEGATPHTIHEHVLALQGRFLDGLESDWELLPPSGMDRGNFLTFRTEDAGAIYGRLHDRGVITDHRRDRLRFGFGVYQDESDVDRLLEVVADITSRG